MPVEETPATQTDQELAVRGQALVGVDGDLGADQVGVFVDTKVLVEWQPTALGLSTDPTTELHIDIAAYTIQAVGTGLSDAIASVIGLKHGAETAGGQRRLVRGG